MGMIKMANEAAKYFNMMYIKYGIKPGFDHYAGMVISWEGRGD